MVDGVPKIVGSDSLMAGRFSFPTPIIAPSILKCDYGDMRSEVERLDRANARWFHWDVMDGHFVPNLSYGAMVIKAIRPKTKAFFDAHLMISDPEKYLKDFLDAGCDAITIHIEAVPQPTQLLQKIRAAGRLAGLAINPKTPVSRIEPYLNNCDLVLTMSVEPGFGGQKFIPDVLEKVRQLKELTKGQALLSIDGGIAADTISVAAQAGCHVFVAGSAIFDEPDYTSALSKLEQLAEVPINSCGGN